MPRPVPPEPRAAAFLDALGEGFGGERSDRDTDRDFYSAAACIYEVRPGAVAWPAGEEDVHRLVAAARATGLPLTARGAGSGVAGHTVGDGAIADLSRHMNRVLEVDAGARRARVQPGVRLGDLNARLRAAGLEFAPDPSSGAFCTIGGMIANNAGGAHSIRHGSTREHIVSLTAVAGTGETLVTAAAAPGGGGAAPGREPAPAGGAGNTAARRLGAGLEGIVRGREEIVERHSMKTARNSSGYDIRGAAGFGPDGSGRRGTDLARLVAGSEGTLAIVTEATLALTPLPGARGTALALFEDLDRAGEAIQRALAFGPSCAELVSETLLDMMRADSELVRAAAPPPARAFVIFEMDGGTEAEAAAGLERLRAELAGRSRLALAFTSVTAAEERAAIWKLRHLASPTLTRHAGARRNMRFIEDACVPPARLADFLSALQRLFARERIEAAIFGHAGDSLVHVNPLMDPDPAGLLPRMEAIAAEFAGLVKSLGGTLTGEHGDGRLRTPFLPAMFGPLYPLFREVKGLFDPDDILNRGVIASPAGPAPDPVERARVTDHVRIEPTPWRAPEP